MSCAFCKDEIMNNQTMIELECNVHLAHGSCISDNLDCPLKGCADTRVNVGNPLVQPLLGNGDQEKGKVADATPSWFSNAVNAATSESDEILLRKRLMKQRLDEPLNPPTSGFVGELFGKVTRKVANWKNSGVSLNESQDPIFLIKNGYPLDRLVSEKYIGLTEMINDYGININDFFMSGYTMAHICDAFPRMNERQGLDCLVHLGLHADHFRLLPKNVMPSIMQSKLGYHPNQLLTHFGYEFQTPENGGWLIGEMIIAGLDMPLVVKAGMTTKQEWSLLRMTAESQQQLNMFNVSENLINSLSETVTPVVPVTSQMSNHEVAMENYSRTLYPPHITDEESAANYNNESYTTNDSPSIGHVVVMDRKISPIDIQSVRVDRGHAQRTPSGPAFMIPSSSSSSTRRVTEGSAPKLINRPRGKRVIMVPIIVPQ